LSGLKIIIYFYSAQFYRPLTLPHINNLNLIKHEIPVTWPAPLLTGVLGIPYVKKK